jgi:hypothetical protein
MGVFFLFLSLENRFLIYLEKNIATSSEWILLLNNKNNPLLISGLEFE